MGKQGSQSVEPGGLRETAFEKRRLNPENVKPRKTHFVFTSDVPKLWMEGSPAQTHFFNAINLYTPAFERFMGRVMGAELKAVADPDLRAQLRGFIGQEMSHSKAHDAYNQRLKEQGYHAEIYLDIANFVFGEVLEKRLGHRISLSTIAGFEHLTAMLSEIALDSDLMRGAHPAMSSLWEWHAAEELEHKCLAFDYVRAIGGGYALRSLGALLGSSIVIGFTLAGMALLLAEDGALFRKKTFTDTRELFFGKYRIIPRGLSVFADYFRPDFHPSQRENRACAERVFA